MQRFSFSKKKFKYQRKLYTALQPEDNNTGKPLILKIFLDQLEILMRERNDIFAGYAKRIQILDVDLYGLICDGTAWSERQYCVP